MRHGTTEPDQAQDESFSMLRFGNVPVALMVFWLVMAHGVPLLSQEPSERVWLAGRYDRARVVIYFEAVQFRGAFPRNARNIAKPAADIMFPPQAVSADSLALLQKEGGLEPFATGDRYDLLLDTGHVATMTLTTLIAAEGDEQTGNDSYIGALGTVPTEDLQYFTQRYYAVRRHGMRRTISVPRQATFAGLSNRPVARTTKDRVALLIHERLKGDKTQDHPDVQRFPPKVERLQAFAISGGGRRYFASATQRSAVACAVFNGWFAATPTLHVLTAGRSRSTCELGHDTSPPRLLSALEIGGGRTGLVVDVTEYDGRSLYLLEYEDGKNFDQMRTLWFLRAGE